MKITSKLLLGDLVRPNKIRNVNVWDGYKVEKCPNGMFRARMLRSKFTLYCGIFHGTAIVIEIPHARLNDNQSRVIGLYVPGRSAFGYSWEKDLVLVVKGGLNSE